MIAAAIAVDTMRASDWPRVCAIYLEGILSGNATFETEPPTWDQWDCSHIPFGRLVAGTDDAIVGWSALSPVSQRQCYSGVAEVSIYVAASARGHGIGRTLLRETIRAAETNGIWTSKAASFPKTSPACACALQPVFARSDAGSTLPSSTVSGATQFSSSGAAKRWESTDPVY